VFGQIFNRNVFSWFACEILLPPAKHDFHNSVSFNTFALKAATNAVKGGGTFFKVGGHKCISKKL